MATMNISLPDTMRNWVEDRIENGMYANNSDYIRDLIRQDQQRNQKLQALQQAVTEGIESGEPTPLDMDEIKKKARIRAGLVDE